MYGHFTQPDNGDMYRVLLLLIFTVISGSAAFSQTQDTIPPTFTWLSPKQFDILTIDTIRLSVDARDNESGSGIKKVEFHVQ